MAISDVYKNLLDVASGIDTFLGYQPTAEELIEFPYDIYKFIIKSIREADQNSKVGGTGLLERFLIGPQAIWYTLWQKANELRDTLFDPNEIDIKFLRGLSKLVGWGDDLVDIWTVATDDQKRKLVIGAIAFWKYRWLYGGLEVAIRLVTGNRFKIRGYFDFRWVLGENMLFEELQNLDIHLLSLDAISQFQQGVDGETQYGAVTNQFRSASGQFTTSDLNAFIVIQTSGASSNGVYEIIEVVSSETVKVDPVFPAAETSLTWFTAYHYDEYVTEIRLVDDVTGSGAVNRDLLEKLLELQRAMSERINICYVTFLDLFQTNNDLFQWGDVNGLTSASVTDGALTLQGHRGNLPTDYYNDDSWTHYTLSSKISMVTDGCFEILFYYQDEDNHYFLRVTRDGFASGTIGLFKRVSGVVTQLGSTIPFLSLVTGVYWTYTIHAHVAGSTTYIKVVLDGEYLFDETDTSFSQGSFAIGTRSDLLLAAHYDDTSGGSIDADFARDGGSIVGSGTGSPSISSSGKFTGALDLTGPPHKHVDYSGTGLVDALVQTGTVEFFIKPGYSGSPSAHQYFGSIANASGGNLNAITVSHLTSGSLIFSVFDSTGTLISTVNAAWVATAGIWTHMAVSYDVDTGTTRAWVGGSQHGTTDTSTGTRTGASALLRIGEYTTPASLTNDFAIDEILIWDSVKYESAFTPRTAPLSLSEGSEIDVGEVELWQFPMDVERVGPYP